VAESFVMQAKSKDGNPVLMTIGPQRMSVFEVMNPMPWGRAPVRLAVGDHRFCQIFDWNFVDRYSISASCTRPA
jgi:hypothetical protein